MLPEGCPFVIGGGLVRDAILGGRPSDIDVWLPSNITIPDLDQFIASLRSRTFGWQIETMFTGPGARDTEGGAVEGGSEYGDVNNHWVLEVSMNPTTPNVNLMRSMTPWTGHSQTFFNGLMRAFDIDYCMFFIGYLPGEQTVNTVIMPQHMAVNVPGRMVAPSSEIGRFRLNSLYWNKYRLDNTSQARIDARLQKMVDKYSFWRVTSPIGTSLIASVGYIELDQIVATPVRLASIMRRANNTYNSPFPIPTHANSQQRIVPEGLLESIIQNRRA